MTLSIPSNTLLGAIVINNLSVNFTETDIAYNGNTRFFSVYTILNGITVKLTNYQYSNTDTGFSGNITSFNSPSIFIKSPITNNYIFSCQEINGSNVGYSGCVEMYTNTTIQIVVDIDYTGSAKWIAGNGSCTANISYLTYSLFT